MNKLFTKISTLTASLMLAIGVGAAVSRQNFLVARAADAWTKTAAADLKTGDIVVIADTNSSKALSNDKGTSKPPAATSISLTDDKTQISSIIDETLKWEVTVNDGKYQFKVPNASNYLYCTNDNNGVRVGTNANNVFTIYDNSGVPFLLHQATSRYVGVFSNQDWRCYTSINNNIKDTVLAFYKRSEVETPATESISIDDIDLFVKESKQVSVKSSPLGSEVPTDLIFQSSDTDVLSIEENGFIKGLKAGTATLTVTSESDITLTDTATVTVSTCPRSGVSVGSIYALVGSETKDGVETKYQFAGITGDNTYASTATYEDDSDLSSEYGLIAVEGAYEGSIALQSGEKYLSWEDGNSLILADTITANSSWVIEYADGFHSIINTSTYRNDVKRILRLNASSSRFACYTSGQLPVTLVQIGTVNPTIKLSADKTEIKVGADATLTATLINVEEGTVSFESSNTDVLTVTDNGDNTATITGVTAGKATVTASLEGCENVSLEFSVLQNKTLDSIELNVDNVKTEYLVGETLDTTGLIVTAHFADADDEIVDLENVDVTADLSKEGEDIVVTVSYSYDDVTKTATYTIKAEIKSLTVTQAFALLGEVEDPASKQTNYVGGSNTILYKVTGYVTRSTWYTQNNNGNIYIADDLDDADGKELQLFRISDKTAFDACSAYGAKIEAVGVLAVYDTTRNYELCYPTAVTLLEEAPAPIEVNVTEALAVIKDLTPTSGDGTVYAKGGYIVTGYVVSGSYWSSSSNYGVLYIADSLDTDVEKIQVYNLSDKNLYDSVSAVGTQVKVEGILALYKKGTTLTYELTSPVVEKLSDPSYTVADVSVAEAMQLINAIENPAAYDNFVSQGINYNVTGYITKISTFTNSDESFKSADIYLADERSGEDTLKVYNLTDESLVNTLEVDALVKVTGQLDLYVASSTGTRTQEVVSVTSVVILEAAPDVVTDIEIKTYPKTEFNLGDNFTSEGLVINATYSKSGTKEITEGFTVNSEAFDSSKTGRCLITVTFEGKSVNYFVEVSDPLAESKASAKSTIDTAISGLNENDYSDTNWSTITSFATAAKANIDDASSQSEIDLMVSTFNQAIAVVKTLAQELSEAQTEGKTQLDNYLSRLDPSNYYDAQVRELNNIVDQAKAAIDAATSRSDIIDLVLAAESEMDNVKNKDAIDKEELDKAIEDALSELHEYFDAIDQTAYDEQGVAALNAALSDGETAIKGCTTKDAVTSALEAAKAALDDVSTKPAKKSGCGGSIIATSALISIASLVGFGFVLAKKKKED